MTAIGDEEDTATRSSDGEGRNKTVDGGLRGHRGKKMEAGGIEKKRRTNICGVEERRTAKKDTNYVQMYVCTFVQHTFLFILTIV